MRSPITPALALAGLFAGFTAAAQTTAFTYQGRLLSSGSPANGIYDLTFTLFATNNPGSALAGPVTNSAVSVSNGLFTTQVDFGAAPFNSMNGWLEIGMRTNGNGAFTTLAPRQQVTPAPYAIVAGSASNLLGALPSGQLSGTYSSAVLFTNSANAFQGTFSGSGAGLTNVPGAVPWRNAAVAQQASPNLGYLATNDNQMTVLTLPASANVGDVVQVAGLGAAGWRVSQNANQSILAGNFNFSKSTGTLWRLALSTNANYKALTLSSDGKNVAVLNNSGAVTFSSDGGLTWTNYAAPASLTAMAASSDGTRLFAVATSHFYTSLDGGNSWSNTNISTVSAYWNSVASSADGSKLFATLSGTSPIYYSTNGGLNWSTNNMGTHSWNYITCSADGTRIAAVGDNHIYYSADTGSTASVNSYSSQTWNQLEFLPDGTRLFGLTGSTLLVLQNGVTNYTTRTLPASATTIAVSSDGSRLAAGEGSAVVLSKDFGATWTPTWNTNLNWTALASSADGSRYGGIAGSQLYISQPATSVGTGGYLVGQQGSSVTLQYLGNNRFWPLSSQGNISAY